MGTQAARRTAGAPWVSGNAALVGAVVLPLLCFTPTGVAQQNSAASPAYDEPEQVAALDELLAADFAGIAAELTADDWVQLSRLLGSPCDQSRWLLAQARRLSDMSGQRQAAADLIAAAQRRLQSLAEQNLLAGCADWAAAWQELGRRSQTLRAITDPQRLREALDSTPDLPKLPPYERFVLLARGAPGAKLLSRAASETWDLPRRTMERLASTPELPATAELLDLQRQLIFEYQKRTGATSPEFGDRAQQELVNATFQIAAAFLDRALGLDDGDVSGGSLLIPYDHAPEAWMALAERFGPDEAWLWAVLAQLLAVSPTVGQPADMSRVARAQEVWAAVRTVSPTGWSAVDDADRGWLTRLGNPQRFIEPRALPLARDHRSARRAQRLTAEQEVARLLAAGRETAQVDPLFAAIQTAKAADLGAELRPLSIAELEQQLGELQPVYLFVEWIELRNTPADGGTRWAGVAVYREQYRRPQAGVKVADRYLARVLGPSASPVELVSEALANGPPRLPTGQIRKDARVILAPDGGLPESWFPFEHETLLRPTAWTGTDASWVVYVPSATALTSEAWTLDETLRVWYRAAVATRAPRPTVAVPAQLLTTRGAGPPLERQDLNLFVVALGAPYAAPENKLAGFLTAKRSQPLPAVALVVHR